MKAHLSYQAQGLPLAPFVESFPKATWSASPALVVLSVTLQWQGVSEDKVSRCGLSNFSCDDRRNRVVSALLFESAMPEWRALRCTLELRRRMLIACHFKAVWMSNHIAQAPRSIQCRSSNRITNIDRKVNIASRYSHQRIAIASYVQPDVRHISCKDFRLVINALVVAVNRVEVIPLVLAAWLNGTRNGSYSRLRSWLIVQTVAGIAAFAE